MITRELFVGLDIASLCSIKFVGGWTVDFEPLVGPYGPRGRTVLPAGFAGYGFTVAPVMGSIFADLVENDKPEYDILQLDPNRFTEQDSDLAKWWGEQVVFADHINHATGELVRGHHLPHVDFNLTSTHLGGGDFVIDRQFGLSFFVKRVETTVGWSVCLGMTRGG